MKNLDELGERAWALLVAMMAGPKLEFADSVEKAASLNVVEAFANAEAFLARVTPEPTLMAAPNLHDGRDLGTGLVVRGIEVLTLDGRNLIGLEIARNGGQNVASHWHLVRLVDAQEVIYRTARANDTAWEEGARAQRAAAMEFVRGRGSGEMADRVGAMPLARR